MLEVQHLVDVLKLKHTHKNACSSQIALSTGLKKMVIKALCAGLQGLPHQLPTVEPRAALVYQDNIVAEKPQNKQAALDAACWKWQTLIKASAYSTGTSFTIK